jgi:hypothetical protein
VEILNALRQAEAGMGTTGLTPTCRLRRPNSRKPGCCRDHHHVVHVSLLEETCLSRAPLKHMPAVLPFQDLSDNRAREYLADPPSGLIRGLPLPRPDWRVRWS